MRLQRLEEILKRISDIHVLVVGDFFLDQYWMVDQTLQEISLETGLAAHQVIDVRLSPGAAGTVANNLAALGVGQVEAIGVIGDDGSGVELLKGLERRGVCTEGLVVAPDRRTPVYTKPLTDDTKAEMERFDIKNRTPLPPTLEDPFLERLRSALNTAHGAAILDQVQEEECGVITSRVRDEFSKLAQQYPNKIFLADSRERIFRFKHVLIKPNHKEASEALSIPCSERAKLLRRLAEISQAPAFMTSGSEGISLFDGKDICHFPALPVSDPIDIVGAGDSVSAAIVSALSAGADLREAAQLANLVASVTIRKLGTTGTASPVEVLETAANHRDDVERW